MTQWKKPVIALLAVLNLGLLGGLVLFNTESAEAQSSSTKLLYPSTNYVMTTGFYDEEREALYIADLSTGRMAVLAWNPNARELAPVGKSDFTKDFR